MSIENFGFNWTIQASADLNKLTAGTGQLFKAVGNTGNIVSSPANAIGVLNYGADNGGNVSLQVFGIGKFVAGASISAMTDFTVTTSGYMTAAGSGDRIVGRTLVADVASGEVGTAFLNFSGNEKFDATSGHQKDFELTPISAQANLSVALAVGKFVSVLSGDFASAAKVANAVLVAGTTSGGTSYGRSFGLATARAGGVITQGQSITSAASGWAVAADSGALILGMAVSASAAGNSGGTFTAAINLATPHYATSSLDVLY